MTIGKQDVLAALDNSAARCFKFTVGNLTVSPDGYADVRQAVSDDDITVTPGNEKLAFYDGKLNTIITPAGDPPLDVAGQAHMLHECTHAMFDVYGWQTNRREDEVAAYLAQLTFMFIANPTPIARHIGATGKPMADFLFGCFAVIDKYSLHKPRGFGSMIDPMDAETLKNLVVKIPDYAALTPTAMSNPSDAGVPGTHNQIEALRRAMRGAKRPSSRYSNVYTPSPRIDIF